MFSSQPPVALPGAEKENVRCASEGTVPVTGNKDSASLPWRRQPELTETDSGSAASEGPELKGCRVPPGGGSASALRWP